MVYSERIILLNILHDEQQKHGYLSEGVLKQIAAKYNIPISRLWGIAEFYAHFNTTPPAKYTIQLCGSPSCILNNGKSMAAFLKKELNAELGVPTKDGLFTIYRTSCIGCCDGAPAMLVNGMPCTKLDEKKLAKLIKELRAQSKKQDGKSRNAPAKSKSASKAQSAKKKNLAKAKGIR